MSEFTCESFDQLVRLLKGTRPVRYVQQSIREAPPVERPARVSAVAVVVTLFRGEPHVLLMGRSATASHHPRQIAFPGGGAEGLETSLQTAKRELEEETGLDFDGLPLSTFCGLGSATYLGSSNNMVTPAYLAVRSLDGELPELSIDGHEAAFAEWVPLKDLWKNRDYYYHSDEHLIYSGPAFWLHRGLSDRHRVWGYTASALLALMNALRDGEEIGDDE